MQQKERLLIADDDESTRRTLALILGKRGYETDTAATGREAMDKARGTFFNAALLDIKLPDMEGVDLLAPLREMHPDVAVIMVTAHASLQTAVFALNRGASAYITKPLNMDEVLAAVRQALEKQRLVVENRRLYRAALRELQERKRAEKEKLWLQEQLAHAQKMHALGTLAGGIAHEFNNIHGAIIGFVELILQNERLSGSARQKLETVLQSAVRGADLTSRLLAFSTADSGQREPVDLRDVVRHVLSLTEKQLTKEGIKLTVTHSRRRPSVMVTPGALSHVVMNLVINAKHAMLKSDTKKLSIQTGLEKGRAFIRVEDAGCGIPKEDISRVFEPFFTTKGSFAMGGAYDGKIHGTGLGLSVCHSIVKGHGGEIAVKSQLGKGTTFTIYLPPTKAAPSAEMMNFNAITLPPPKEPSD